MVNQWGRDGSFGSGQAGSRSAAGIIIPAIVALVIGAGGGYAGARFLSGASASDLADRDKRIAELNQTLSEIKFDNQGAATQQVVLRQRVKDLQDEVDQLKRHEESLKTSADQQSAKAMDDAQTEIAALRKTIAEAGDLSGQLARTQKSLKVSELQIIELEKTVSDLSGQLAEAKKIAAAVPTLKSRIVALQKQLDDMTDSLAGRDKAARDAADALKQVSADLGRSQAQVTVLRDQNKTLAAARDDLAGKVASLNQTIAALRKSAAQPKDIRPGSQAGGADERQNPSGLTPRASGDVQKAIANLPGYDGLSADRQQTLVAMLQRGECVTDALKAAYGHVSPVALRSLFRDLGGGC